MRVIIADDHPVVLGGIKVGIKVYGNGLEVVGEACQGQQLLMLLERIQCDLLVTDFSMPSVDSRLDGLALIEHLRKAFPNLPILVYTMYGNPVYVQAMLAAGVHGVIDKSEMISELWRALDFMRRGRRYLSDSLRAKLNELNSSSIDFATLSLSPREAEVIRFLAQGMTITEIARHSNRSIKTVSLQKRAAMRKLGLNNDKMLYDYVRAMGIL